MITPHFPRCKESDFPELVALGRMLGIIDAYHDLDTNETRIYGINGCDWDLVFGTGKLYKGTGIFTDVDGMSVEQKTLIVDEDGLPYIHVNVNVRFDLGDKVRELAASKPELAQALSNLGKYFLLDAEGKPRRPANPQCSFGNI